MKAMIAAITSFGGTIVACAGKGLLFLATTVGGWLASIGLKLLSFQWIKSLYGFLCEVVGFLKKTIFNAKFVKVVRVVLSLGIFALAVVQAVFIGKVFFAGFDPLSGGGVYIAFFVINVIAIIIFVLYLFAFIAGLFKKKIRYGFVAALLSVYLVALFSLGQLGEGFYRDLVQSFDVLKLIFIILFAALALFKLIEGEKPTSVWAFLLCVGSVVLCFLAFTGQKFAVIPMYGFSEEIPEVAANNVNIVSYIRIAVEYFSDGNVLGGVTTEIFLQSVTLSSVSGVFVAGVAVAFNGFIIIVCTLAPYLLFSAGIGFLMSLLNDRISQYIYLTKTLKTIKYLFWGLFLAFVGTLVLSMFYNFDGGIVRIYLSEGNCVITFLLVLGLAATAAISRKLIADKFTNKLKLQKIIK